tara:strand:- start:2019 stop:2708 length:690 start_codon:yes stop_codon:yes gene_type:complete
MTTYAELKQQILDYTETDSNVLTDTIINDFIEHSESKLFREIDLDVFRKYKIASLTANDPFVAMPGSIPADFEFVRYIHIFSGSGSLGGLTDNERIALEKKDASYINEFLPNRTTTGIPKYYANWDNNTILLAPAPNAAYTVELAYNAQPTGLSSSNTTTWISNNAPLLLLYACLVEAFKFLKSPDMLNTYAQSYSNELQVLAQEQMGRRRRDEYMDGTVRVSLPVQQP